MAEYISREEAVDDGYLSDWYIASVGDESPVWTDAHIDELLNDFIVIPKDTKAADVQPVVHAKWKISSDGYYPYCSRCFGRPNGELTKYCPDCGARMDLKDGDAE